MISKILHNNQHRTLKKINNITPMQKLLLQTLLIFLYIWMKTNSVFFQNFKPQTKLENERNRKHNENETEFFQYRKYLATDRIRHFLFI